MEKLKKTKTKKRFVLDIREGCAAVIDTKHPYYMDNYPGIHPTTPHVVEFRHGIPNYEKKRWEMRDSDIKFLTDYCASLNNE